MKYLVSFIFVFISVAAYGQQNRNVGKPNLVFPKGLLVGFHPYVLEFDSTFEGFVTLNDRIVSEVYKNYFCFAGCNHGTLRIFQLGPRGDTNLIKEISLGFVLPESDVFIDNYIHGSTLNCKKLRWHLSVEIPNTEASFSVDIASMKLHYFYHGDLKEVEVDGREIPQYVINEITEVETANVLVLDIIVKVKDCQYRLPQAVFYLK